MLGSVFDEIMVDFDEDTHWPTGVVVTVGVVRQSKTFRIRRLMHRRAMLHYRLFNIEAKRMTMELTQEMLECWNLY